MKNFILLCLLLGACGDDAALADDVTADADPRAPDARADADPAAPDAGADADPTSPDAGADDAGQTCAAFPCWYECDPVTGGGCPTGGMCLYYFDNPMDPDHHTYCDGEGPRTTGQTCEDGTSSNPNLRCVPGELCVRDAGDWRCHTQCTNNSPGCVCTPVKDGNGQNVTFLGEFVRYCR